MKKLIVTLLAFSLCLGLAGCHIEGKTAPHTYEDLTILLPADFIDLSDEAFAEELDFVFGLDPIAVNGLREEKAVFAAYGLDVDLQRYGELIISSNNIRTDLEEKDGILTFSYTSGDFTYVVTLWETDAAFWTVQAYCPTKNYNKAKKDIWEILSSITVIE